MLTGKETILLLDDEQMVLDVGKPLLEKLGYKVHLAMNAESAIAIYKEFTHEIDLVIIDMNMPDMDGGQVYDRLKALNPDIKALLSSGYTLNDDTEQILSRGCDGFIQKPFGIVELSQKVRSILDR